jgi:hypothetical protein
LKTDPYAAVAGVTERLVVVAVCAFATTLLIKVTNATKTYVNELWRLPLDLTFGLLNLPNLPSGFLQAFGNVIASTVSVGGHNGRNRTYLVDVVMN